MSTDDQGASSGDAPARGGYRGTTHEPTYTEQVCGSVTSEMRDRVLALARGRRVSQATILRECLDVGLPSVEAAWSLAGRAASWPVD